MKPVFALVVLCAFPPAARAQVTASNDKHRYILPILHPLRAHPEQMGDDAVAEDLNYAVKNFFALQEVYLRDNQIDRDNHIVATAEERRWATKELSAQSAALDRLIPLMEIALQKTISPADAPAPKRNFLSYAVYIEEGAETWKQAQPKANLAGTLVFVYRSKRSKNASQEDLARAEARLPKLRAELAQAKKAAGD